MVRSWWCLKEVSSGSIALTIGTFVGKVMSLLFNSCLGLSLEKAMAPHSSTLSWKIPWMEEPGRLQSMGVAKSRTRLSDFTFHLSLSCIGEGNGNPLRCSCLENPRDGGAWRAAVCGVAQSRTRLSSSSRYLLRAHNNNCPCAFCKS